MITIEPSFQKTKIIATIGPASNSYEVLLGLAMAGVDVFRLNFSHGTHQDHLEVIERINYINDKYKFHLSILADLQGPKIRVGEMKDGGIDIAPGDILTFTTKKCVGTKDLVHIGYDMFPHDINAGEKVLCDDGNVVFECLSSNGKDEAKLVVLHGSKLKSKKGINLPETKVSLPALTEKDLKDLEFILTQNVHWIALSFVRHPKDVKMLRDLIDKANHPAKIISKIEKPEAVERISKIIKNSNAIMIARGDLGIEVPMEKLPAIQKMIVDKCLTRARPVIVATQMMDSMVTNPTPTRAEITDVANAVIDGADAVMLSAETSVGDHPVKVVEAMTKIICEAEKLYDWSNKRPTPSKKTALYYSDVMCLTAGKIANEIGAAGIVGITASGYTAFRVSSYRPDSPIYIFSSSHHMLSVLNLVWGVKCFYYDRFSSTDETIDDQCEILKEAGQVEKGDVLVNTAAMPLHKRLTTNMCKVTVVE